MILSTQWYLGRTMNNGDVHFLPNTSTTLVHVLQTSFGIYCFNNWAGSPFLNNNHLAGLHLGPGLSRCISTARFIKQILNCVFSAGLYFLDNLVFG